MWLKLHATDNHPVLVPLAMIMYVDASGNGFTRINFSNGKCVKVREEVPVIADKIIKATRPTWASEILGK